MTRRRPPLFAVVVSIFALLCAGSAAAQAPACAPLVVEVDARLTTRWPELSSEVRAAFMGRDDIDRCARVALSSRDSTIAVEVVLPDGRAAARSVSRGDDVLPTLESLLLLPQSRVEPQTMALQPSGSTPVLARPGSASASASRPGSAGAAFDRSAGVLDGDVSPLSQRRAPSRFRIELSAIVGARMGDGQTGVGLGAGSLLDLSGWLVEFQGRVDRYQTLTAGSAGGDTPDRNRDGGALELALLLGRRFRLQSVALDLSAGPAAALQGTATFETASNGRMVTESSSSTAPRLLLGARISFNAQAMLHSFVGVDGELGPSRVGASVPGASQLPLWTLGLSLGATVGSK